MYDSTQVKTFLTCPFKYYLKFCVGLVQKESTMFHLEFGLLVHTFLEELYKRIQQNNFSSVIKLDEISKNYIDPVGENDKTNEGFVGLCKAYTVHWLDQDKKLKILNIEQIHTFDFNKIPFVVKLDTEIEFQDNKYSFEHKTTRMPIKYNYFDAYFLDQQITAQAAAMQEKHTSTSGVMVNVLAVKQYKKNTKDHSKGYNFEFKRSIINRTPAEIDDWRIQINYMIKTIEQHKEKKFFPKALMSHACMSFNSVCPYANICKCSKGMEVEEQIIENMYDFVDPLEYLKPEKQKEVKNVI